MAFVLDASVALAWCFVDERTRYATSVLEELRRDKAFVPAIWHLELRNGLLIGERRKRISETESDSLLRTFDRLPIMNDEGWLTDRHVIMALARKRQLSAYDASYLELALRLHLPLATQDRRLRSAAKAEGVTLAQSA